MKPPYDSIVMLFSLLTECLAAGFEVIEDLNFDLP
jgi:hypothetical protein